MTHDHDLPELPDDPELERATRDLLRHDPLEIDPERREQAITAALGATEGLTEGLTGRPLGDAGTLTGPTRGPAVVPLGRRRDRHAAWRPALVAAAAILAIATGVFATVELGTSGSRSEDMAATGAAENDRGTSDEAGGSSDSDPPRDATAGSGSSDGFDQESAPTTTAAAAPTARAALPALGDHRDADELLDAAQRSAQLDRALEERATSSVQDPSSAFGSDPCEPELASLGWAPFATATIAGAPVVLALVPGGAIAVLDGQECTEITRR